MFGAIAGVIASALAGGAMSKLFGVDQHAASGGIKDDLLDIEKISVFVASRSRHTRCGRDWSSECALPIYLRERCAHRVDRDIQFLHDVKQARAAADIMQKLYVAVYAVGASLAEINPLVTTPDGTVQALDAKIAIDDNELERRPDIPALRDPTAEAPEETAPREAGLTLI